jgi:hypothetical protein
MLRRQRGQLSRGPPQPQRAISLDGRGDTRLTCAGEAATRARPAYACVADGTLPLLSR